jgi:hypothetical protein
MSRTLFSNVAQELSEKSLQPWVNYIIWMGDDANQTVPLHYCPDLLLPEVNRKFVEDVKERIVLG